MIVICDECSKKYRIDPAKIKDQAASFKCRACEHLIVASKLDSPALKLAAPQPASESRTPLDSIPTNADDGSAMLLPETGVIRPVSRETKTQLPHTAVLFGMRSKMLVQFLFIPMLFMAGASVFYLWQFEPP